MGLLQLTDIFVKSSDIAQELPYPLILKFLAHVKLLLLPAEIWESIVEQTDSAYSRTLYDTPTRTGGYPVPQRSE
jgi:hypothetical protein